MKKRDIIIIGIVLSLPFKAEAAYVTRTSENTIAVSGDCLPAKGDVLIHLVEEQDQSKGVYTAGTACRGDKFMFSDDLSQWHIADGRYMVLVNGEKTGKIVTTKASTPAIQDGAVAPSSNVATETAANPAIIPESPDTKFLDAFVALQQSLADMRTWLADSKYPDPVKSGLDAAIDGIDKLAGKMSDILFAADSQPADSGETVISSDTTGQAKTPAIPDSLLGAISEPANLKPEPVSVPTDTTVSSTIAAQEISKTAENLKVTPTSSTIDKNGSFASGGLSVSDSSAPGLSSGVK
ncbi:MAG: hypothetical protein WCL23_00015 [Candidatus Moraniibacteriota bacterium]